MKRRRSEPGEERRRQRVEINLLAEGRDSGETEGKRPRGCSLPFGGTLLIVLALVLARSALG